MPSRLEAENFLTEAQSQSKNFWSMPLAEHCRVVARFAETVAKSCGLDAEKAYILGLLHDIGRYEEPPGDHHVFGGYRLMKEKGYDQIARVCLSHSFPLQDIRAFGGGGFKGSPLEAEVIGNFLNEAVYDDYDKLIQLGDAVGKSEGVCLIEVRQFEIIMRHGFDDFTLKKWDAIFSLKNYFDKLCGMDIYDLFYDEVRNVSFRKKIEYN